MRIDELGISKSPESVLWSPLWCMSVTSEKEIEKSSCRLKVG